MSEEGVGSAQQDPLLDLLQLNIRRLLITKGRLPLLKALAAELMRVGGGDDPPLRNADVLQIVRDSFRHARHRPRLDTRGDDPTAARRAQRTPRGSEAV
jgi:hypothetical protein